jgi:5-methylcytosine-specific restriction endonuclease McrA
MELRTLVLTSGYQAHSIVSWQDAICLLYKNKLDVVSEYDACVSSPSVTIHVPAVIRLRKGISMYKDGVKFSRANVYTRDGYKCCYCGHKKAPRDLTYDHVIPRSRGGKTTFQNIVTSCKPCNLRKGNKTPQQAGMRMLFKPHRPTMLTMSPVIVDLDAAPEQWLPWLSRQAQSA